MAIFDTSFLNKTISCTNKGEPDPETGCIACGENAINVYEQCRQTYFLKKQNEIFIKQSKDEIESTNRFTENIQQQLINLDSRINLITTSTSSIQNSQVKQNLYNTLTVFNTGLFLLLTILFIIKFLVKHKD